jgi:hypothetical protein
LVRQGVSAFAQVNPVTLAVDAVRSLTIGHGDALSPLGTFGRLVGLLIVFLPPDGAGVQAHLSTGA